MSEQIKNIVVIGGGLMGCGIAQIFLMAGYNVKLVDIEQPIVNKAIAAIEDGLKKLETKGLLITSEVIKRLKTTIDLISALKDADFIIEAVVEDMSVKKNIFKICDEITAPHCILATNTSTMSITEIATATKRPDKCIGMHFFNPPPLMRLVEVIKGEKSSEEVIELGVKLAQRLPCLRGDRFIAKVLKDRPGFIVNRLNAPISIYTNYIIDLAYDKGISWEQLDADTGGLMPMPPLVLTDYVGLDTRYHIANYYSLTLSPDFRPGKVIIKMIKEGKLGRKTGQGFYDWSKGKPEPNMSQKAGLLDLELMEAIRLNEGCRIIEEGVVTGWKVIDDANMAGMNTLGPFSSGINNYQRYTEKLEEFVKISGKEYLKPCDLMKNGKFVSLKY